MLFPKKRIPKLQKNDIQDANFKYRAVKMSGVFQNWSGILRIMSDDDMFTLL